MTSPARADLPSQVTPLDTQHDGIYGRFDGDFSASAQALVEWAPGGPAPGLRFSTHYFWMAGVYASFVRPFESNGSDQLLSFGIDLRPAFLPRFSLGQQTGPAFVDLMIDSISLSLGPYWAAPQDQTFGDERGLEASLGFGIPLSVRAPGPWLELRGLSRLPDGDRSHWALQLGLSWQFPWDSPWLE